MSESHTNPAASAATEPSDMALPGAITAMKHLSIRHANTTTAKLPQPLFLPFAPFPGTITIDSRDSALDFARFEYSSPTSEGRMVFWTDSSTPGSPVSPSGIGVMYKRSSKRWVDLSFHIATSIQTWVAEIAAISKALQIAREETARSQTKPGVVVIYSDSQRALSRLKREVIGTIPGHKAFLKPGLDAARYFERLGVRVELRWVPGHHQLDASARIQGNRLAHSAARKGAYFRLSPQQAGIIFDIKPNHKKKIRAPVAVF